MQLGFNLPISGPTSGARSFARLAQEGEAMGYDYLTLTDHVVLPDVSVPGYPYSESGEFMSNTPTERHELLTATAFIAAKTSRIRLVLAVLVVPHRPAVLAAKMLSTIDVLSEGRLVVGIGAGWLKAEFDAVVTTPFAERGAVTDEYLEAFRALWTQEHAKFEGRYAKFSDLIFLPRPVQQPHPPITIGGSGEKIMLKLVARFADRWNCPAGYESFEHKFNVLKQHCKDVGRDVNTIDISEQLLVCIGQSDAEVEAKWKAAQMLKPFVTTGIKGTPKQLIEELKKRVAMGITTFTIFFSDFAPPPTLELFAKEVMPAFA
ncbi:MAG TPA: TIGR03619 family F420-dependent LLM class oxidoreductase [Candidatus Limnocylindrales bacterium]|nr:TIGR03619 family F420-dependent LLM class oxidoreductase [Candidatus Limnocylindrales bacterium]